VRRIARREAPAGFDPAAFPGLHPLLARALAARGLQGSAQIDHSLGSLLPPDTFKDLDRAVAVLADAVQRGAPILVIGDYDADGATSTALCVEAITAMGGRADFLVPDRFRYGYGLSPEIVEVAVQREPAVILTVDNGISSLAGVARARDLGMRVVVTDHHLPGAQLPVADAIVNPNQPGCAFPGKSIAGVGVAFYVMSALRSALRAQGWFDDERPAPNLADLLDLVALGTVADVVPLDANNRILVEQGLRRIRAGRVRPGLAALIGIAQRNPARLVASDLGYAVGPRLNAAGRLDDMAQGIRCLLAGDTHTATQLAAELDALNRDRRSIEGDMQQAAEAALAKLALDEGTLPDGICLFDDAWHPGVVGILASRIKERCHRPVIAFAPAAPGSDELRGSARSIEGVHVRDVLDAVAAHHPDLLTRFGGHAMAAGLTLARANLPAFAQAFDAEVMRVLPDSARSPVVWSDGELPAADLDLPLAEALRRHGPWGQSFPEPLFDGEFEVLEQRLLSGRHLKMVLAAPVPGGRVIDAIAFNVVPAFAGGVPSRVRLAYRLDVNEFRGRRSAQLVVECIEAG
jgi:single-stranded-DNA-specific exonuclease